MSGIAPSLRQGRENPASKDGKPQATARQVVSIFPDQEQLLQAMLSTRRALGLAADTILESGEISVFFKYLLILGLKAQVAGLELKASQKTLRDLLETRLGALLVALRMDGDFVCRIGLNKSQTLRSFCSSKAYPQRLIDLALASTVSENLAPEICLESEPWPVSKLNAACPGGGWHAVIFADAVLFHHEFYPLAVDAYVHDSKRLVNKPTHIVGVHVDWLSSDGMPMRVLFLDVSCGCLREVDLISPIHPDSVQFHSLGRNEQKLHQHWSAVFSCPQINPYGPSQLADDKAATLEGWAAMGMEVPAFVKLAGGDIECAERFAETYCEVVVKPNQSTEGESVRYFNSRQHNFDMDLANHLKTCWVQGDAIIQQRRDGLVFRDNETGTRHTLVLRLNLAFDGKEYHVESGYVQLAKDTEHPAARSQGGRIVSPLEILDCLSSRNDPSSPCFSLGKPEWATIGDCAAKAASLFRGLLLVGLDVLLDMDSEANVMPVFLEANPRPAGLCHSRLLDGYPDSCHDINGVSLKLWDGLEHLLE